MASALAELSEVKTTPGQSVDDLLRSVVAERIPNFAGFPYEEGLLSCGALAALLPNFRVRSDSPRPGRVVTAPVIHDQLLFTFQ
jgi:hypothetical protein